MQILPSTGVRITRTPSGTTLGVATPGPGALRAQAVHPFNVIVAKNDDQGVRVQVLFGTVNGIEPTIDGQWLHNFQPEPPTLPVDDGSKVYLKANLDSAREVASAQIEKAADVPQNSSGASHILIAQVQFTTAGGNRTVTIAQNVASSLGFRTCKNPEWSTAQPTCSNTSTSGGASKP